MSILVTFRDLTNSLSNRSGSSSELTVSGHGAQVLRVSMALEPMRHSKRIYPHADRPPMPIGRLFQATRPHNLYAGDSNRRSACTLLRGRGTKIATVPAKRPGLRQKDGFDLALSRSSFGELKNLSRFRRDVISRIRKNNSASLDMTTGTAVRTKTVRKKDMERKGAGLAKQEREQFALDGVLLRLRQVAVEQ